MTSLFPRRLPLGMDSQHRPARWVAMTAFDFSLEVGFDCKPDLHPQPGLGCEVVPDCSLASIECKLLILELLEVHS